MSRSSVLSIRGLLPPLIAAWLISACATGIGSRSGGRDAGPAPGLYGLAGGRLVLIGAEGGPKAAAEIDDVSALTYDPAARRFYAIAGASSQPRLVAIDPATGEVSAIGPIAAPDPALTLAEALAFDPDSGILYAAGGKSTFASNVLLTVDPATGEARRVAPIRGTIQNDVDALVVAGGALYAVDSAGHSSALYRIDAENGAATRLGAPFGKSVTDLAFDPASRRLFAAQGEAGPPLAISLDGERTGELSETMGAPTALAIIPSSGGGSLFADSFESGDASAWSRHSAREQG